MATPRHGPGNAGFLLQFIEAKTRPTSLLLCKTEPSTHAWSLPLTPAGGVQAVTLPDVEQLDEGRLGCGGNV